MAIRLVWVIVIFFISKSTHIKDGSLQKVAITIFPTQDVLIQENKTNL